MVSEVRDVRVRGRVDWIDPETGDRVDDAFRVLTDVAARVGRAEAVLDVLRSGSGEVAALVDQAVREVEARGPAAAPERQ